MSNTPPPDPLSLMQRDGLPDPLRALIKAFPRDGWEENPNYSRLIAFWLDRHMMFRRLLDQMEGDAQVSSTVPRP